MILKKTAFWGSLLALSLWAAPHSPALADGTSPKLGDFSPFNPPLPTPNEDFQDALGGKVTLADFKSQVVVLNFWASCCGPCQWIMRELGPDVPLHFSAFHPDWKMRDVPPTPASTLTRARDIALKAGLHYVYTGNVHDTTGGTTACPNCHEPLIVRDWYRIDHYSLMPDGNCPHCGVAIAGCFGAFSHAFGNRRIPIALHP